MRLWYFLRFDSPAIDEMSVEWENAAKRYVERFWSNNPLVEASETHFRAFLGRLSDT